jgi:hypothetical protein
MNAPKKQQSTEAKTAQTGMMSPMNFVGKQFITPTKDDDNFDEENVVSVDVSLPTKDEIGIAARQEKLQKALMTAKGRRHKKSKKSSKKTKKSKRKARK